MESSLGAVAPTSMSMGYEAGDCGGGRRETESLFQSGRALRPIHRPFDMPAQELASPFPGHPGS